MQLFVKCPLVSSTGECCHGIIAVEVDLSETIGEVKFMIHKRGGLKIQHQQLSFFGMILEDSRRLDSYKIAKNSVLEETSKFLIVTTDTKDILIESNFGQTHNIVRNIKALVQEREGYPIHRQIVLIKDVVQENNVILSNSELSGVHIVVIPDNTGPMEINVNTLNGLTQRLKMKPTQTVIQIKCYFLQKNGVMPNQQSLVFNQKQLENGKTLSDYNIQDDDTLHLVLRPRSGMKIHVKTVSGKTTTLSVKSSDTINAVKSQIRDKEGVSVSLQCLSFKRKLLDDNKRLSYYNVQNESTLDVFYTSVDCHCNLADDDIRAGNVAKIDAYYTFLSVAFADGRKQLRINVNLYTDTVLSLKARICGKVPGIPPPSQQQLVCNGSIMEDSHLLRKFEMSIFQRHTIVLSIRVRQQVYVRTPNNNMIDVQILSEKKISTLKCLIRDRTCPPIKVSKQQLYYQGTVLENTHTISRYNLSAAPMLQLCRSQCLYEPLEEEVGSEGKLINWQQHGVKVTVPPVCHGHVELRVYNGRSTTSFEYPPAYSPLSNVHEVSISSREGEPLQGVTVTLEKFVHCSTLHACLLVASRNPSKWTPDLVPVFKFYNVEGMETSFITGRVEVTLLTSGVYLLVADYRPLSACESTRLLHTIKPLVEPVISKSVVPRPRRSVHGLSPQVSSAQVPVPVNILPHGPHYPQGSSPEYRTMLFYTKKLNDIIAFDPQRTCDEMMAAGLIQSDHVRDFVYHPFHTDREKAAKLVHRVTDRVKVDPSEFNKFVAILKKEPLTDCIGQDLLTALTAAKNETD